MGSAHHGVATSVGKDVPVALAHETDGVAVDVGSVGIGCCLVRQDVREQRDTAVAQLAAHQGTEQGPSRTKRVTELDIATKADRQHELLAPGERDVRRPESLAGLPSTIDGKPLKTRTSGPSSLTR